MGYNKLINEWPNGYTMSVLVDKFNKCGNDEEKWDLILSNKDNLPEKFMLRLEDGECWFFGENEEIHSFDGGIGEECGKALLDCIGIPCGVV